MALLIAVSVLSVPATAAELTDGEEAAVAEVGASAPTITAIESTASGLQISWNALSGVAGYRVYRWYDDGRGWVRLQDLSALTYTDKSVTSGKSYRYRLVGINTAGNAVTDSVTQSATYHSPALINNAETTADGIRIYWQKPDDAAKTAVFRWNGSRWQQIATADGSSYLDKDVSYGNEYRYTVRGLTSGGTFTDDDYDENGYAFSYLATPVVRVENAVGGVNISWNKVEGAVGYRVFYRGSGGWSRLASTDSTSYFDEDVRSGNSYTYTVRCITADGEHYNSYFDTSGKTVKYIAAPVLTSAESIVGGVKISWKASAGADGYRVFYRNSGGSWTRLGTTSSTSIVDTDVRAGSSYTYTVRCINAADEYISSFYGAGISCTYLSAPEFSVSNGAEGVDIRWNAVSGAEKYRVYYYGSRGWTKLADTTEPSFTDTDVESNYTYTYTVRCISADGTAFTSGYLAGKSVKYIAAPKITSLSGDKDGVQITWGAVAGAQKYRVYYYGANGWTRLTDTAGTSYYDDEVSSGYSYTYTVRCINAAGNAFMSYFKPGVSLKFISAPDFKLTQNDKSITVSWDKVEGAELYRVYLMKDGSWKKLADTTQTSFEHTAITSGETYTYTVRCLNAAGNAFTSDFREGKSLKYVETPRFAGVANTVDGVQISWHAVPGAAKYRVYYKSGSGWTKIDDTTDTTYVHTTAVSGTTYTYTVRCINAAGNAFESSYDSTGTTIHYIAAPRNLKAESERNAIRISWTASQGAAKYRVYYMGSGGWKRLTETTDTSVTDSDIVSGYTYTYTVRCVSADGNSFTSDFNHDGVACKYTVTPTLKPLELTKDGINISWSASKGAEKYRVYYYGSKGWTKMAETTSTSYLDTDVSSGYSYRYTVRCITEDGTKFTSDCDTEGVKIYYVAAPKLLSTDTDSGYLNFTWTKPNGAAKYRVYRRISGSWRRLAETTSNSFTDYEVYTGETYIYTVRVVSPDGETFLSSFDSDGFIITVTANVTPVTPSGDFVYYDQGAYNYPYGDDTIAYSGCGPTCFAMVASTLTGKTITPIDAVKWCGNKYYVDNVGTRWDYFAAASNQFGVKLVTDYDSSQFDSVITALKQGKYVISSQSAGIFTRGGHFIVLAGVTSAGKIIVYDPNGGNHYVGTAFTRGDITASGTHYWVFDKK